METEEGRGTMFQVYLPICVAGDEEGPQEEAIQTVPGGRGETILLVEDNERIRKAGQAILESLGYQVLMAANGQEALEVRQTVGKIDLVLTDVVMPEMGGVELVRELRKADPHLKALAITGHLLEEDREKLCAEGVLDVVYKPFDVDALTQAVRNALDAD